MSVGNDVVDLAHPRCRQDRPPRDRLLRRILTPEEEAWLEGGGLTALRPIRLWALWAAKEAAYKVLRKLEGGEGKVFRPRALHCELRLLSSAEEGLTGVRAKPPATVEAQLLRLHGSVATQDGGPRVQVEGNASPDFIHVVGWNGEPPGSGERRLEAGLEKMPRGDCEPPLDELRGHFTAAEWAGVYSLPSARARLLARARLESRLRGADDEAGEPLVEILTSGARSRRSLPRIRVRGRDRPELSISLSHHGRYVAWAILSRVRPDEPKGSGGTA